MLQIFWTILLIEHLVFPPGPATEFKSQMTPTRTGGRWAMNEIFVSKCTEVVSDFLEINVFSLTLFL